MRGVHILAVLFLAHVAAMVVVAWTMPEAMPEHLSLVARAFSR